MALYMALYIHVCTLLSQTVTQTESAGHGFWVGTAAVSGGWHLHAAHASLVDVTMECFVN